MLSEQLELAFPALDRTHSYSFRMFGHLNHTLFQYFLKLIQIPYRSCSRSLHVRVLIANPLLSNQEEKCIRLNCNVHKISINLTLICNIDATLVCLNTECVENKELRIILNLISLLMKRKRNIFKPELYLLDRMMCWWISQCAVRY